MFPVPVDPQTLKDRLNAEESQLMRRLAQLEERIRSFEDLDLPEYEAWIRLALGPSYAALEELHQRIHARRIIAYRVNELVEKEGLHPREALFIASVQGQPEFAPDEKAGTAKGEPEFGPEAVEARRRAKREAKREARRERKKEDTPSGKRPRHLIVLYRALARQLHPDSSERNLFVTPARAASLWLEVQAAYDSGNLDRLTAIAAWLGEPSGSESVASSSRWGERFDQIRSLKNFCVRLQEKVSRLAEHPAWDFRHARNPIRKKLRQRASKQLAEEIQRTQDVLDLLEEFLKSIGPPRPPKRKGLRR